MVGITAFGGYVPRLRLSRKAIAQANAWSNPAIVGQGKFERSMCNWDEDSLTMGVEAARDCLTGLDRNAVQAICFASTTAPFLDRQNAGVIATALNLPDAVQTLDVGGSQRAGTSALAAALGQVKSGDVANAIVVAADHRLTRAGSTAEMNNGDGAAAMMIGNQNVIAEYLGGASVAVDFVDHFRGEGEAFDYEWEERWIRDEGLSKIVPRAIKAALEKTGIAGAAIDHFVMPCTFGKMAAQIAKGAGVKPEAVRDNLHAQMGEAGAAHALVMLAAALEDAAPGQTIAVVAFGQGCDVLLFRTTEALKALPPRKGIKGHLADRREESNYMKFLAFNGLVVQEKGKRAEFDKATALSVLYRKKDMILGLIGGRCTVCGTLQFPKAAICVNPNCHALHSQEDHPFQDEPAKIMSWSADYLTYTIDPPAHYGMVTFEEGGRFMTDFTDCELGQVESGMPVKLMFRIKDFDDQRGFRKYFWKAVPQRKEA
jgi:3-hydroxy-3-methylglutaryl CoA synthase